MLSSVLVGFIAVEHEAFRPMLEGTSLQTETGASKWHPGLKSVPQLLMLFPFGTGLGGLCESCLSWSCH